MKTSKLDDAHPRLISHNMLRQGTKTFAIYCVRLKKRHSRLLCRARLGRIRKPNGGWFWFVDHGGKAK